MLVTIPDNITGRANAEFQKMMNTEGEDTIRSLLKDMTLEDLRILEAKYEATVIQESTIPTFTKNIFPITREVAKLIGELEDLKTVMEYMFEMVYIRCYFNADTKQFDHAEFQLDIEKEIIRAETKAESSMEWEGWFSDKYPNYTIGFTWISILQNASNCVWKCFKLSLKMLQMAFETISIVV